MCGIIGYVGKRNAQPVLLDGLARLEYRGYDSAGMAVMDGGIIRMHKARGKLANLRTLASAMPLDGLIGVGHTRWATHGEPSDVNAHPHIDRNGRFAVVHNGIIENHRLLRQSLEKKGYVFASDTDSEVLAHLLHSLYSGDMTDALLRMMPMLEGSYALCILCLDEPDRLYCVRKDSPLVIGLGEQENLAASDVTALIAHTRTVDYLHDGEIGILTQNTVRIFDSYRCERKPAPVQICWDLDAAEKGGYAHFMLKEIHEEPDALMKTLTAHADLHAGTIRCEAFHAASTKSASWKAVHIAACGTACHAGLVGKSIIEQLVRIPVSVETASEYRYRTMLPDSSTLVIVISQSGETADTLAALRMAKAAGSDIISLTNTVGSTIDRETDGCVLHTCAGPEIAVASTKAYVTQVELLLLLAVHMAVELKQLDHEQAAALLNTLSQLPEHAHTLLQQANRIQRFADHHVDRKQVFFIGRGLDYAVALEASLKLKEVSYVMCEAYAAGEMKHGVIALIEPGTLVCALLTQPRLADKTIANIREVRARGAKTLIICTVSLKDQAESEADELWTIPDTHDLFTPLLSIIPLQLLAYYMAVSRGCDVDQPRNLAKSVTVE